MEEKKKNPGGRPRKYDREKVFNDLVEWSKTDNALILADIHQVIDVTYDELLSWIIDEPKFACHMKQIRLNLASKRERLHNEGKITYASYGKYQRHYDIYLKQDERDELAYEYELKASIDKVPANDGDLKELIKSVKTRNGPTHKIKNK